MTKTLALLLDSYRELNAKRLFWIVLVISGFVVGAFAMIGMKGDSITVLWWKTPIEPDALAYLDPAFLYKSMFTVFGVGFWLNWLANILALISTAGIFPDFMAEGAIDLYLSKPISRFRLFAAKYAGGLLFVTAQVTIFSFCSFLVLGFRGKLWAPSVFIAIPVVLLVFSYLFSICVLIGVLTRSTIAALLLTLLAWFTIWGVQSTEGFLLTQSIRSDAQVVSLDRQIAETKNQLQTFSISRPATRPGDPATQSSFRNFVPFGLFSGRTTKSDLKDKLDQLEVQRKQTTSTFDTAHSIAFAAMAILPKTQGTTQLLDRALMTDEDRKNQDEEEQSSGFGNRRDRGPGGPHFREQAMYARKAAKQVRESRTSAWIISTSLAFELVIVSLAAWLFCRRDY